MHAIVNSCAAGSDPLRKLQREAWDWEKCGSEWNNTVLERGRCWPGGERVRREVWRHQTVSADLQDTSDPAAIGVRGLSRYLNHSAGFWPVLTFRSTSPQPHLSPSTPPRTPPIIPRRSIVTVLSIIHNINIHSMAQRMDGEDIGGPSFQYWSPSEGVDKRGGDGVIASWR